MKKKTTKVIAILLSVIFVFAFASCNKQEPAAEETQAPAETEKAVEATAEEATQVPEREVEETTLTVFVQQSASSESGIWQGWAAKKLYDDTKIILDFYPTGNEVEQKLKQYLAGGVLPDVIGLKGLDQAKLAMDAGMLLPMNEYTELLPNIFEEEHYASAIKYSKEYTSNDTGNLYIMPTAIGPVSYNSYNWVPLLQWGLYKEAGMPEVGTLEDYLDLVEQMVALKPTTDEGEKIYGFSLFSDWDKYTALEVSTLSYFYGIDTEYVSHLMETDVVTKETSSILEDDSFYKRALHFYFEANQRGLLDPDSLTQTFSNVMSKYSAGRILFSWFSWMTGSYNSPSDGHVNNEENPDGYASVLAQDMKIYEAPDQTIGRNWYYAISNDTKEPDRACDLMNWLYDLDNIHFISNGPEGSIWEYDENGEPHIIDPEGWNVVDNKTEPLMPAEGGGSLDDGAFPFNTLGAQSSTIMDDGYTISYRYWPSTLKRNPTLMKIEVTEFLGYDTLAEYVEANDMVAKSTLAVNMIPPISDEMEMVVSQIGEVVKKYSWQMIFAKDEAEFESLWATMVSDAEGLGMADIVAYYEAAWAEAVETAKEYE